MIISSLNKFSFFLRLNMILLHLEKTMIRKLNMKKFKLICIFLITTTPNLAASQREQHSCSEDSALRKSSFDDQLVRFPPIELFFFNDTATTEIYTLSLHDALPS